MTEGGKTTYYTYNGLNQLTSKTDGTSTTTYTYDGRGNQIQEKTGTTATNFTYAVTGEMLTAANGSTVIQQNEYNHDGTRIAKTEGGTKREYLYDNGSVAYTLDDNSLSGANVLGGYQNVIGTYRDSSYYVYNKDVLGSTESITDGSFSAKAAYEYSDFGEVTELTETIDNEICYTGSIHDETTGLHYMNARYYDPANGRFISQDSYRGELTDSNQWHLYVYCANNPINYVDPSGHKSKGKSSKKPKSGSKIWFCLKTTKKKLESEIMPYYKRNTTKEEFENWLISQIMGDLYSLYCDHEDAGVINTLHSVLPKECKIYRAVTILKSIKGYPIVGWIQSAIGLRKAFYNGSMHKIYEKTKAYYDNDLKGKKNSFVVYFCTQMKYKRKGREGAYLPTETVKLFSKKVHPHSV